ncbi:MAG: DUF4416 family protein [Kiritimatiellaeota bacterium]|nr:DUF4416 family protein [Kiritimatiellota bacterium]
MLILRAPLPVKLFAGVLLAPDAAWEHVRGRLEAVWGPADLVGAVRAFTFSDYYEPEMGPGLVRRMIAFERLVDPACLPGLKIQANGVERQFIRSSGGRTVNVDVGVLDYHRVVLASTKEGRHKIYLARGVWADLTLAWRKGRFESFPWTFADFATGAYDEFLTAARERYRLALRQARRAAAGAGD